MLIGPDGEERFKGDDDRIAGNEEKIAKDSGTAGKMKIRKIVDHGKPEEDTNDEIAGDRTVRDDKEDRASRDNDVNGIEKDEVTSADKDGETATEKEGEMYAEKDGPEPFPVQSSDAPGPSPWHPANQDWMKMGTVVLILFGVILITIVTIEVLGNFVMILFSILFLGFLLSIAIILFRRGRLLKDYRAAYFGRIRDPHGFLRTLQDRVDDELGGYEERDPVTGNTFGLIHHLMTMELTNGELVSVNEVHMSNSGVALGTYILVKASNGSRLWSLIDESMKR